MNKLLLTILVLSLHTTAYCQGRHTKFLEVAIHGKYQSGFYTLLDGTRHAGKLRTWQNLTRNLVQVDQGKADPINLAPEELRSFTISSDSFIIARNVAILGMPNTMPFGEVDFYRVVLTGKLQIFEHDQLIAGGLNQIADGFNQTAGGLGGLNQGPVNVQAWVLRPPGESNLVVVPNEEKAFAQNMAGLFVDSPLLCQRIRAGFLGIDDFKRIIYAYVFKKEIGEVSYEVAATIFR